MRAAQPIAAFSGGSVSAQSDWFSKLAVETAVLSGKPVTFLGAVAIVAIWGISGPIFHFSDTWQLVINTGTTIITFLMVFLIQATQNRDTLALQIKLSELILALEGARNELAAVEKQSEQALENIVADIRARERRAGIQWTAGHIGAPSARSSRRFWANWIARKPSNAMEISRCQPMLRPATRAIRNILGSISAEAPRLWDARSRMARCCARDRLSAEAATEHAAIVIKTPAVARPPKTGPSAAAAQQ
jgi:low affinity Fe/Cu permease